MKKNIIGTNFHSLTRGFAAKKSWSVVCAAALSASFLVIAGCTTAEFENLAGMRSGACEVRYFNDALYIAEHEKRLSIVKGWTTEKLEQKINQYSNSMLDARDTPLNDDEILFFYAQYELGRRLIEEYASENSYNRGKILLSRARYFHYTIRNGVWHGGSPSGGFHRCPSHLRVLANDLIWETM